MVPETLFFPQSGYEISPPPPSPAVASRDHLLAGNDLPSFPFLSLMTGAAELPIMAWVSTFSWNSELPFSFLHPCPL